MIDRRHARRFVFHSSSAFYSHIPTCIADDARRDFFFARQNQSSRCKKCCTHATHANDATRFKLDFGFALKMLLTLFVTSHNIAALYSSQLKEVTMAAKKKATAKKTTVKKKVAPKKKK